MRFPSERVEGRALFDDFFEDEHDRLFKALYFVTGNRHDAEELMQDAFLKLWERWGDIHRLDGFFGFDFGWGHGECSYDGFRGRFGDYE